MPSVSHRLAFGAVLLAITAGCSYQSDVTWGESDLQSAPRPRSRATQSEATREFPSQSTHEQPKTDAGSEQDDEDIPTDGEPAPPADGDDEPQDPPDDDQHDDSRLDGIVAAHNLARSQVSPTPQAPLGALAWSDAAASVAREWAANCEFGHNSNRGNLGENIFASTAGAPRSADYVVESWASEASDYDYDSNSCSGVCGHYTQVVWRNTTAVGCAVQVCSQNSPFGGGSWELWVCNYAPPGNYNGQRPY